MILRNPYKGEKLDVAGLNEITVLIDRSETALTEIGMNKWRIGLEGPPHAHDQKEQMFYVTSGIGSIIIGSEKYQVKPGHLLYIPTGVKHQSLVGSEEPLVYLLFNAFSDSRKEGHSSFADHIDKVKMVRKAQAEGDYEEKRNGASTLSLKKGKCVSDIDSIAPIINREETDRCGALLFEQKAGAQSETFNFSDREQSIFVLSGSGQISAGDESRKLTQGDLVFIPAGQGYHFQTDNEGLKCLCLNTFLDG